MDGATVLDGDAEGVAELAAVGGLQPDRALFYAGDLDRPRLASRFAAAPASSSPTRIGAGCWRRISCGQTRGRRSMPTIHSRASGRAWDSSARLAARPRPSPDIPACSRRAAPSTAASALLPEHRAFAALDGRLQTSWLGGSVTSSSRRYLELAFDGARAIPALGLYPVGGAGVVAVSVNGDPSAASPSTAGGTPCPSPRPGSGRCASVSQDRADLRASPSCASPVRRSPRACGSPPRSQTRRAASISRTAVWPSCCSRTTRRLPLPPCRCEAGRRGRHRSDRHAPRRSALCGRRMGEREPRRPPTRRLTGSPASRPGGRRSRPQGASRRSPAGVPPPRSTGADRPRGSRRSSRTGSPRSPSARRTRSPPSG